MLRQRPRRSRFRRHKIAPSESPCRTCGEVNVSDGKRLLCRHSLPMLVGDQALDLSDSFRWFGMRAEISFQRFEGNLRQLFFRRLSAGTIVVVEQIKSL